jgi:hypothetical protein
MDPGDDNDDIVSVMKVCLFLPNNVLQKMSVSCCLVCQGD